jgi:hypothetical protein
MSQFLEQTYASTYILLFCLSTEFWLKHLPLTTIKTTQNGS